jgi:NADPH:quinone reductase-like Zn-dependent oxidoreductase
MRAALFRRHGGPEVMEVAEVPAPEPGPGEVLVEVRAAALNHIDLWLRRGLATLKVQLPHVPGADVCGVVAGLGPGVAARGVTIKEGDRVVVNPGVSCGHCVRCLSGQDNLCPHYHLIGEHTKGGQAERLVVPSQNVVPAPAGPSDAVLASIPIAYMTAWQMLVDRAKVQDGETVLVMAAGSGVGVASLQIARLRGARVIAAASTEDKRARARALGADEVVSTGEGVDLAAELKRLTGKRGVDVVVEHVGAPHFPALIKSCARGGRIVTCGATAGYDAAVDLRYVFWRQIAIMGSTMSPKGRLFGLVRMVAEGRLAPVIDRVLPLEQVQEAHRAIEEREVFGKVVLAVSAAADSNVA